MSVFVSLNYVAFFCLDLVVVIGLDVLRRFDQEIVIYGFQ